MTVLCRFNTLLEPTMQAVLDVKVNLDVVVLTTVRLLRRGDARSTVDERLLTSNQLQIIDGPRKHVPNLRTMDRVIAGQRTPLI